MISGVWLDTAIGVALFFLVMSFVASAAVEAFSQLTALRANTLRSGIESLIKSFGEKEDRKLLAELYGHSLIKSLADNRPVVWGVGTSGKPSYIPSKTFAAAFLDIVAGNGPGLELSRALKEYDKSSEAPQFVALCNALTTAVAELPAAQKRGAAGLADREAEAKNLRALAVGAGDSAAVERLDRLMNALTMDRASFEATSKTVTAETDALARFADAFRKNLVGPKIAAADRAVIISAVRKLDLLTSISGRSLSNAAELIAKIENDELRKHLSTLLTGARTSIDDLRQAVAVWFDDSMDRVSGWYKRRVQLVNFLVGLVVAVAINADAIHVMRTIATNEKLRGEMVALATVAQKKPDDTERLKEIRAKADLLPIGWYRPTCFIKDSAATAGNAPPKEDECARDQKGDITTAPEARVWRTVRVDVRYFWELATPESFAGWFLTALAVMLGAPFWFDALSALVRMRGAGKVPPTAREAAAVTGGGAAP